MKQILGVAIIFATLASCTYYVTNITTGKTETEVICDSNSESPSPNVSINISSIN